jgi:hypothetical protein
MLSAIYFLLEAPILCRQWTMTRDSVPVPIEPVVASPKHPIKTWQREDCIERPGPPDSSCHIKICIRARLQLSAPGQYPYVVQ